MKYSELVDTRQSLGIFADKEMPWALSRRVAKIVEKIDEEVKWYEEKRLALFQEWGEVQENGDIKVDKTKAPDFMDKLKDLEDTEVELDFTPLKRDDFNTVKIAPNVLRAIDYLFEKEQ